MSKLTLVGGLLSAVMLCFGQTSKPLMTTKYAGIYSYGDNPNNSASGMVTIYPETDSTVLFYLDLSKGAPSYNLGQLYDRLKIKNGEGRYSSNILNGKKGCKWSWTISDDELTIKTLDNCYECGFGNAVTADNQYKRKDYALHEYFTDGHGHKIYFAKTSPGMYLK